MLIRVTMINIKAITFPSEGRKRIFDTKGTLASPVHCLIYTHVHHTSVYLSCTYRFMLQIHKKYAINKRTATHRNLFN